MQRRGTAVLAPDCHVRVTAQHCKGCPPVIAAAASDDSSSITDHPDPTPTGNAVRAASAAALAAQRQVRRQHQPSRAQLQARQLPRGQHGDQEGLQDAIQRCWQLRQGLLLLRVRQLGGTADSAEVLWSGASSLKRRRQLLAQVQRQQRLVALKRRQLAGLTHAGSTWRRSLRGFLSRHVLARAGRRSLARSSIGMRPRGGSSSCSPTRAPRGVSHAPASPAPGASNHGGWGGDNEEAAAGSGLQRSAADLLHEQLLGDEAELARLEQLQGLESQGVSWCEGPGTEEELRATEEQQLRQQLAGARRRLLRLRARRLLSRLPGLGGLAALPWESGCSGTVSDIHGAVRACKQAISSHQQVLRARQSTASAAAELREPRGALAQDRLVGGSSRDTRRRLLVGEAQVAAHQQRLLLVHEGAKAMAAAATSRAAAGSGRRQTDSSTSRLSGSQADSRHSSQGGAAPGTLAGGEAAARLVATFPRSVSAAAEPASGHRTSSSLWAPAAAPQQQHSDVQDTAEVGEESFGGDFAVLHETGLLAAALPMQQARHEAALAHVTASLQQAVPPWMLSCRSRMQQQTVAALEAPTTEALEVFGGEPAWRDAHAARPLTAQEGHIAAVTVAAPALKTAFWRAEEAELCVGRLVSSAAGCC